MTTMNHSDYVERFRSISLVKLIVGIDLTILVLTFAKSDFPVFKSNRYLNWVMSVFDLSIEMNFAVWWSSILLFFVALLAYQQFLSVTADTKIPWLFISIIFLGLSIDEIGSLHERILPFSGFIPVIVLCAIILPYTLAKLFKNQESKYSAVFLLFAVLLFGFTAVQERLEHAVEFPSWAMGLRTIFEEGTELGASLMGLIGVLSCPNTKPEMYLRDALPRASTIKRARFLLFASLLIHCILSTTVLFWTLLEKSGNPIVWYPMIQYFILFLYLMKKQFENQKLTSQFFLLFSIFSLVLSAIMPFVFFCIIQLKLYPERWIFDSSYKVSFLTIFHAIQFFMCGILFFVRKWFSIFEVMLIFLIVFITLISLIYYRNPVLVMILIGCNSYIYYYLIVILDSCDQEMAAR
jgi:hypothetical protein